MSAGDARPVLLSVDPLSEEIRRSAVKYMVEAMDRAWFDADPFPHVLVEGLFPDDIYREMLAMLPDPSHYTPVSYERHAKRGVSNRDKFALSEDYISQLGRRQRALWSAIRDALGAPEFKAAVFNRLSLGLSYRFGSRDADAALTPGYALPELLRETRGYRIKPHPDTRRKVVTMQIALPEDNRQANLGTQFYGRSWSPLSLLREPRGFEVVKQSPFLPNTAYAFVVLNTLRHRSWHGRTTLRGESQVRNSILNIWYAKPEDGNREIIDRYYCSALSKAHC
jgi:hypothetical protein